MLKISLVFFSLSLPILAAGKGGDYHGSVTDLIWPYINALILFGFMGWKLKSPLGKMFEKKRQDIQDFYQSAQVQHSNAEKTLKEMQMKLSQIQQEKERIQQEADKLVSDFEMKVKEETENKKKRIVKDNDSRIEFEKRQNTLRLQSEFLDKILNQTKETIKQSQDFKQKASQRLISEINL